MSCHLQLFGCYLNYYNADEIHAILLKSLCTLSVAVVNVMMAFIASAEERPCPE